MKNDSRNDGHRPSAITEQEAARRAARRKKRMRRRIFRICIVLAVLLLIALIAAFIILRISGTIASERGETTNFLAVESVVIEGDTRYDHDALIKQSGIYVGESLLAVNKRRALENLLAEFPYLDTVEVSNTSFSTVTIRVKETDVLAATHAGDGWLITGTNNHALERVDEAGVPTGTVRVLGADLLGTDIGQPLLEERSLRICRTLTEAAAAVEFTGMTAIDMTEKTYISITWQDRVDIVLGNESNLAQQMAALKAVFPTFRENNGEQVAGRIDMTSYADDDTTNDKMIFTPADILEARKAEQKAAEEAAAKAAEEAAEDQTSAQVPASTQE